MGGFINFFFYIWAVLACMYELMVIQDTKTLISFRDQVKTKSGKDLTDTENGFYACMGGLVHYVLLRAYEPVAKAMLNRKLSKMKARNAEEEEKW